MIDEGVGQRPAHGVHDAAPEGHALARRELPRVVDVGRVEAAREPRRRDAASRAREAHELPRLPRHRLEDEPELALCVRGGLREHGGACLASGFAPRLVGG